MKETERLYQTKRLNRMLQLDPNSEAARQMAMQQMAAKFIMEVASSIFVREVSDLFVRQNSAVLVASPLKKDVNDPDVIAEIARDAFVAARLFLGVSNEPIPSGAQERETSALKLTKPPAILEG